MSADDKNGGAEVPLRAFNHQAMSTWWQVRISGEDAAYADQAAQAAFAITDRMECLMSRFREESEISLVAHLPRGGSYRLSKPVFDCLVLAEKYREATAGAFDVCAASKSPEQEPRWHLDADTREFVADSACVRLDLGAIAKGFTLDQMAEELLVWGIEKFLLMSSGSSILAGSAPDGEEGWRVRLGENTDSLELLLTRQGLGASGNSLRGDHIIDPVSGTPSHRYLRSWALSDSAAEADALSTAWMNMEWAQICDCCARSPQGGAAILDREGKMQITGEMPSFSKNASNSEKVSLPGKEEQAER